MLPHPARLRCWPRSTLARRIPAPGPSPGSPGPPTFSCPISPLPAATPRRSCRSALSHVRRLRRRSPPSLPGRGRQARGGSPKAAAAWRRGLQGQQGGGGRGPAARGPPHLLAGRAGLPGVRLVPSAPAGLEGGWASASRGLQAAGPGGLPSARRGPRCHRRGHGVRARRDRRAGQNTAAPGPSPAEAREAQGARGAAGVELPAPRPARREGGRKASGPSYAPGSCFFPPPRYNRLCLLGFRFSEISHIEAKSGQTVLNIFAYSLVTRKGLC